MKTIPLSRGMEAIVDDADYSWLSKCNWYAVKKGGFYYAVMWNGHRKVSMHRMILGLGYNDGFDGDHKNHHTLDNRRANLRAVTRQQNTFNSDHKGYSYEKHSGKFRARIMLNGKSMHLGRHNTASEARAAYLKAKQKYHRIYENGEAA